MVLSQISNKFHRFQQITKQGKVNVFLNSLIDSISFIWDGILSHNFEPMYDNLSNPWLTILARGIAKYEWFLILYLLSYRKSFCKNNCTLHLYVTFFWEILITIFNLGYTRYFMKDLLCNQSSILDWLEYGKQNKIVNLISF